MGRPLAKEIVTWYHEAKTLRNPHEQDWRMAAAYCLPRHFAQWQSTEIGGVQGDNSAARRFAYDSTGVNSVPKYAAILNRLATPESQRWHRLQATDNSLMRIHHVRQWFDQLGDLLFKMRYQPRARFTQATGEVYTGIGVYGIGPYSVTWRRPIAGIDRKGGFSYKAWPLKDIFILVDDAGVVTVVFRRFMLNYRQFVMKFPGVPVPKKLAGEAAKPTPSEMVYAEFVHVMHHRTDYEKDALDARRHPICASYVAVDDQEYVGDEEGFASFPMLTPRTFTEPGDLYGYAPAIQALPALGGVSAMKKTLIKAGHKAVDPTILAYDDGVLSGRVDLRPGRVNPGGVNAQGNKLVHALEVGNFQVAEKLIQDERTDIQDAFLVTLFQILTESPEMTATEVMERVAEKASLLAPTMGRLQAEMLGPQIEREIALLVEHNLLPEMPPELEEAAGEYDVVYTSPLARGQYAEEVSGFMRWYEMLLNAAQVQAASGDPINLPTDWANLDAAAPEIANYMSVRTGWVNDDKQVGAMRKTRGDNMAKEQALKQAPAAAAIAKEAMKNGGGIPGVSN